MSKWEELKLQITESPVWKSIFRHGYDDTPRNRVLMVSGNVFLPCTRPRCGATPRVCASPGAWAASRF